MEPYNMRTWYNLALQEQEEITHKACTRCRELDLIEPTPIIIQRKSCSCLVREPWLAVSY